MEKQQKTKWYHNKVLTWIMVFLFFPVGLAMMWSNKKFSVVTKIITTVFLVFIIAFGSGGSDTDKSVATNNDKPNTEQTESKPTETENPKTEEKPVEVNPQEQLVTTAKKHFDNSRVVFSEADNEIFVTVDLKDNLTNNMIITSARLDIFNFLKESQNNEELYKFEKICFIEEGKFINKYGEESVANAMLWTLKTDDVKRMKFENLVSEDISKIAITEFIHPSFKN